MANPYDLIKEVGYQGRLIVSNEPTTDTGCIAGSAEILPPFDDGDSRVLICLQQRTVGVSGPRVVVGFTPDQALAIAIAIMKQVNAIKEGDCHE